ncbi:MAG: AmmeMemoRadiSam system protein B [Thermoanaerobaculia bacterium]
MKVRPVAVAGSFYPADPRRLEAAVRSYLAAAGPPAGARPKALVAPHAGFVYSGPVAGSAFRQLEPWSEAIDRVVLLGPSHFVPFAGLALPAARAFATPLGDVPVAAEAETRLADLSQVIVSDVSHGREHALEVELPFLQIVLRRFELVPLVVGEASPEEVAEVLDRLWGGAETLIVVSTDLSHFHDYATAAALDRATADAIVALDVDDIAAGDACGRNPLRGLLLAARRRGLVVSELDLLSSGDTAGARDRVVGYGAFAFA